MEVRLDEICTWRYGREAAESEQKEGGNGAGGGGDGCSLWRRGFDI